MKKELPDVEELVSKSKVIKEVRFSKMVKLAGGVQETDLSVTLTSIAYSTDLDGGGSTQLLVRNLTTDKFEIRNRPSDGSERGVINAWAIMHKGGSINSSATIR